MCNICFHANDLEVARAKRLSKYDIKLPKNNRIYICERFINHFNKASNAKRMVKAFAQILSTGMKYSTNIDVAYVFVKKKTEKKHHPTSSDQITAT